MRLSEVALLCILMLALTVTTSRANGFVAMTAPSPPYSISSGLHVTGISVDTLAVIMSLSGVPMESDDVKLMLWQHGLRMTAAGPHKIMLNVPKTEQLTPMFKWVGPIGVERYVVIGRKGGKRVKTLADLNRHSIATIRNSASERAILAFGINKSTITSSLTHVIPLKQLSMRMVDFFVHTNSAAAYLMGTMRMKTDDYSVVLTFLEVPIYYAFSMDTKDGFIAKLNENLQKLKKPGKDGVSRFDRIVGKYLPQGALGE